MTLPGTAEAPNGTPKGRAGRKAATAGAARPLAASKFGVEI